MTGWGQDGPLAQAAGHDINYIALTGALHAIGPDGRSRCRRSTWSAISAAARCYLAFGVLAALLEARQSGKGQVVDAAMSDGAALADVDVLRHDARRPVERRGASSNMLDGGAHFYGIYECADGKYVSIGAIEPQFYALLRKLAASPTPTSTPQMDRKAWPALKEKLDACSRARRATSGARSWRAPTSASRRC